MPFVFTFGHTTHLSYFPVKRVLPTGDIIVKICHCHRLPMACLATLTFLVEVRLKKVFILVWETTFLQKRGNLLPNG